VRRQHARRRPIQRLELEERVCVDDHGNLKLREQPTYQGACLVSATEPGADRDGRGALRKLVYTLEGRLHRLQQPCFDDR
jgi:hypothetical protein